MIALSASVFEHNRQESLAAGCEDFIPKPVKVEKLLERLKKRLKLKWIYYKPVSSSRSRTQKAAAKGKMVAPSSTELKRLHRHAAAGEFKVF